MDRKEQAAQAIALTIIKWKVKLTLALNKWFDHFSKKQQRCLLAGFCLVFSCGIILCILLPYGKTAISSPVQSDQPIHIGSPSQYPFRSRSNDSLTLKK